MVALMAAHFYSGINHFRNDRGTSASLGNLAIVALAER
jgi:hypothetical protein